MVFIIDDLLEGGLLAGLLASISATVFGTVEAVAVSETGLVLSETIGVEGVDAIVSYVEGSPVVSYVARGVQTIDELSGEEISMFDQVNIPIEAQEKEKFFDMVSRVATSLSKKIPRDAPGFKVMLKDIVQGVLNHKGKLLAGTSVGITAIGGLSVLNELRKAYNNGKKIPNDVDKIYNDVKDTGSDIVKDTSDTISDVKGLISDVTPDL